MLALGVAKLLASGALAANALHALCGQARCPLLMLLPATHASPEGRQYPSLPYVQGPEMPGRRIARTKSH